MSTRSRYRKPIITFEHGTRIYAPSPAEARFRVVATDVNGARIQRRVATETEARREARDLETMLARSGMRRGQGNAPVTVGQLIDRYLASLGSRSVRYGERQEYLLRMWVRPVLDGHPLDGWTPSDSEAVLDRARRALSPATVQNVGSAMRSLVTFAYKNRWLPRESDPMWLVRYSPSTEVQGQVLGFIPRTSLPTDEQCGRLFSALDGQGHHSWSLAMQLKHRCGARWGELIALRPVDLEFGARRVVRIHRAVEQSRQGSPSRRRRTGSGACRRSRPAWSSRSGIGPTTSSAGTGPRASCSPGPTAGSPTAGRSSARGRERRVLPGGR